MPSVYSSVLTIRDYANNCADIPWDVAIGLADDLEKEHDRLSDIEQARAHDSRCGELLEAAKIFGALLQPLHDEHKDHHPIYGINSVTITAGDLRRLTKAIAAFEVGK